MNKSDKALAACIKYDFLMAEIKRNTKKIGEGFSYCTRMVSKDGYFDPVLPDGVKSHIQEVFAGFVGGDFECEHRHYGKSKAIEIIGECAGCLKSYNAVQERKMNKKKLGAVKRAIRMIGRP